MPDKAYINTTLDKGLLRKLRVLAASEDKKINTLLQEAILLLLNSREKKKTKK